MMGLDSNFILFYSEISVIEPDADLARLVALLVASNDHIDGLKKNLTAVIEKNVVLREQLGIPEGDATINYDQLKVKLKKVELD